MAAKKKTSKKSSSKGEAPKKRTELNEEDLTKVAGGRVRGRGKPTKALPGGAW